MKSLIAFDNFLTIKVLQNGHIVDEITKKNLVLTQGMQRIIKYLNDGLYDPIMKISIGKGTTAPVEGDVALESYLMQGTIIKRTEDTKKVVFEYLLGVDNLNGEALTEAGLVTDDGILFARVVHDAINKTSLIQLLYSWTVNVGGN